MVPSNSRMNRRSFLGKSAMAAGAVMGASALLEACGSAAATNVTLDHLTWTRAYDAAAMDALYAKFHAAHSNISVTFENKPTDYATVVQTRLSSNSGPDIFGANFSRGALESYIQAGNIADLSNESWVSDMNSTAQAATTFNGKTYGLGYAQYVLGAFYSKKVFSDLKLTPPTTHTEFLTACETIKKAGIAPIAWGLKDAWTSIYLPYNFVSAYYRDNPTFDADVAAGKNSFSQSAWVQALNEVVNLIKLGYISDSPLGTTYEQALQLTVAGKAAMVINGSWFVADAHGVDPNFSLGVFPVPVNDSPSPLCAQSIEPWLVYAKSKHLAEAKEYLGYWARQDGVGTYLNIRGGISALKSITAKSDPAFDSLSQYQTIPSPGLHWPAETQQAFFDGMQGLFANTTSVPDLLQKMDTTFRANYKP